MKTYHNNHPILDGWIVSEMSKKAPFANFCHPREEHLLPLHVLLWAGRDEIVKSSSICWQYALAALARGAVLGGSSAGAMILADHFYDPYSDTVKPGLGLLRGCCIIPHFRRFGARWHKLLTKTLPEAVLIGIDEHTGIINDFPGGGWTVHSTGRFYLGRGARQMQRFRAGKGICYDALQAPQI